MSYLQESYQKQNLLDPTEAMPASYFNQEQLLQRFLSLSVHQSPSNQNTDQVSHHSTYIALEEIESDSPEQRVDSQQNRPSPQSLKDSTSSQSSQEVEHNDDAKQTKTQFKEFGLHPLELTVLNEHTPSSPSTTDTESKQALYKSLTANSLASDLVIQDLLGAGGMGMVFGGTQNCLNREVAFKISRNYKKMTPMLLAQVCHEAQITAQLSHARIPPVYLLAITPKGEPIQVILIYAYLVKQSVALSEASNSTF